MNGRRWIALALAVTGLVVLATIPPLVLRHLRETAARPPGSVVNGTVVDLQPSGKLQVATVEFTPSPQATPLRFRVESRPDGRFPTGLRLGTGDPVMVEFDPAHPEAARLFSIADLWSSLARRGIAGALLLVLAILLAIRARA